MKVAILAGGLGTRLMEETTLRPKPMVEIGGRPILWHIMQRYAAFGLDEFVVALGYKGEAIKEYFLNYRLTDGDLLLHPDIGRLQEPVNWDVSLVDTGEKTMTGGRLRRLAPHLSGETFMVTYGDGLADVDIAELLAFHRSHGRIATLTAVQPPERSTRMVLDQDRVAGFQHSDCGDGWINGGFFVFEPELFDYLGDDTDTLEVAALSRLARDGQLMSFRHEGFWQCMDTVMERDLLESLWRGGQAPWLMAGGATGSKKTGYDRRGTPTSTARAQAKRFRGRSLTPDSQTARVSASS